MRVARPPDRRLLAWLVMLAAAVPCAGALTDIDSLALTQTPTAWTLEIPFAGEWTCAAAADPPRIVVDLIGARSRLAQAPDPYTLEIPSGPVTQLHACQVALDPGREALRVTLVLRGATAYGAVQSGGHSSIVIFPGRDAAWGEPWSRRITGAGANAGALDLPAAAAAGFDSSMARAASIPPPTIAPRVHAAAAAAPAARDPGDAFHERLDRILDEAPGDATRDEGEPVDPARTRELAATRAVDEAQRAFVKGDTTGALDALLRCEQFYADTDAGRQGSLLRRLFMRQAGRIVEADLGPAPPAQGPWPLVREDVLGLLCDAARARGDFGGAQEVLEVWRRASATALYWAPAALRLAEACFDAGRAEDAVRWAQCASLARPDLSASPKTELLLAGARAETGDYAAADALLRSAAAGADAGVRQRALAQRADLCYRQDRFGEAQTLYEQLLADGTSRVERDWARFQCANCLVALGDAAGAAARYREVALDTQNVWAASARLRALDLAEVQGARDR
jgi:tetratricopeptide (TPR) repeat protein